MKNYNKGVIYNKMKLTEGIDLKGFLKKLIDKKSLTITLIFWVIWNILGVRFAYFNQDIANKTFRVTSQMVAIKVFSFIFLYIIIANFSRLYKNKKSNKNVGEIYIGVIYFIITFILLLFVWPGTWSLDDIDILKNCSSYDLTAWQHFMSGLYMGACLQLLPFASGFIMIQILFASFIVGYSINGIVNALNIKNKKYRIILAVILFLPTIFPPVLSYLFSGFRMGIYTYIDLLLISKLLINYLNKTKIDNIEAFYITILTIIVASWRTEAIYYIIAVAIVLLLYGRKMISIKKIFSIILISLIATLSIMKINNYLIGTNNYSITGYVNSLTEVVRVADKDKYKNELKEINDVFKLDMIYNSKGSGITLYWNNLVRKNYSDEDYKEMIKAFSTLLKNYPKPPINFMCKNFIDSTGIEVKNNKSRVISNMHNGPGIASKLYDKFNIAGKLWAEINSIKKYPLSNSLRNKTIYLLACTDENLNVKPYYYIFWNLLIPLILCSITVLILLVNKKWVLAFIGLTILGREPLVLITAPSPFFMYNLPVYLMGYIFSIVTIVYLIKNAKKGNPFKKIVYYFLNLYEKHEEIANYLISGALGVLVSVASFKISRALDLSVVASNIVSWVIAVIFMYVLNKIFVFKTDSKNKIKVVKEFINFVLARVFTLIVETIIVYVGIEKMHGNETLVKIIGQVVIIILNYILSKLWIFKKQK